MRRLQPLLLALALVEAAAGCAGPAGTAPGPAFKAQEDLSRSAAKALARGDLRAAITAQERALVAARSVEDVEGIALRILDLAALYRAAGEAAAARGALAELLAEPLPLAYPARWRAEAARLAGLLDLDDGDAAAGSRSAARALELCSSVRCPNEGTIVNLQARAAYLAGDLEGAVAFATKARSLNRAAGDEEETANSLRILADAESGAGRHTAAARDYAAALDLDKKLGLPSKILLDLFGLGRAATGDSREHAARDYFERARAVALASGDEAAAAKAGALIGALSPPGR